MRHLTVLNITTETVPWVYDDAVASRNRTTDYFYILVRDGISYDLFVGDTKFSTRFVFYLSLFFLCTFSSGSKYLS